MNTEDLVDKLVSSDLDEYTNILSDIIEHLEEVVFMLKNPYNYTRDERKHLINVFRKICEIVSNDTRTTNEILMKLNLYID